MPRPVSRARGRTDRNDEVESGELPPGFAPLIVRQIQMQTDAGSFQRGQSYFRGGRVFGALRRGSSLSAGCFGSSGGPYRVEATLATTEPGAPPPNANPLSYICTCPRGGFCKHVVALLLTWIDDPDAFEERLPVANLLAGRSRESLIALIETMLGEAPELEDLIELPLPTAESLPPEPVSEAAIRRQITAALGPINNDEFVSSDWFGDYGPSHDSAKLARLAALGAAYGAAGRWRDALASFAPLIEAISSDLESFLDEGGEMIAALLTVDRVLAACLTAQAELPEQDRLARSDRERLVELLLELWEADVEAGGFDIATRGPVALAAAITPAERQAIEGRIRSLIAPPTKEFSSQSSINRAAIGFLGLVAGDGGLSPEQLLEEYRTAGLVDEAAGMLLELGRVHEAIAFAGRNLARAAALTRFAERLIALGGANRVARALDLVESRLWEREGQHPADDAHALQWLESRYADHGRLDKALQAAQRRFKLAPHKGTYDAVKVAAQRLAGAAETWPSLRADLLAALQVGSNWSTIVDIHLDEGAVAEALAAFNQIDRSGRAVSGSAGTSGFAWSSGDQEVRLAAAAEVGFPDEAIAMYRRLSENLIARRERPSYAAAAQHLARVKEVLDGSDRTAEWTTTITEVRQQHKTLRALREELDNLGLR